jgi:hypothetical protein
VRTGLVLAAGIGIGAVLAYAVIRVTCRTLALLDDSADSADGSDADDAGDAAVAARQALAQVTDYAARHPVFRRDWDSAVRQAADAMTATIAGRWMAGQAHGEIGLYASYPSLPAIGAGVVEAAFQLAVHGEVTRRIGAMDGPGAFG